MKTLIPPMIGLAACLLGCGASHYQERHLQRVTFYLTAPGAEKVDLVTSLDAYRPHRAVKQAGSRWAVTVADHSEFRYFYLVDGSVYLPECDLYEKDDFGSLNCVYVPKQPLVGLRGPVQDETD